jgi:hypothetical protein
VTARVAPALVGSGEIRAPRRLFDRVEGCGHTPPCAAAGHRGEPFPAVRRRTYPRAAEGPSIFAPSRS